MALRLKMMITSVKRIANSDGSIGAEEIFLNAVTGDSPTNKAWSKWTPSGSLSFTVTNPDAFGQCLPGQYVHLTMTPADKDS